MARSGLIVATVGALVAVPVGVLASRRADRIVTRTARLAAAETTSVTIMGTSGSVTARTAPAHEVRVRARLAERGLDVELIPSADGSSLTVRLEGTPQSGASRPHLDVTVPERSSITVRGAADLVEVLGARDTPAVDVSSQDGEVRITGAAGVVSASTGGGALAVEGSFGTVSARTATGDITAKGVMAELRTETKAGRTTVEVRSLASGRLESASGNLEVAADFREPTASNSLEVESMEGTIRLRVPETLEASYEIRPSRTAFSKLGAGAVAISPRILGPERPVAVHAPDARTVSLDRATRPDGPTVSFTTGSGRTRIVLRSVSGTISVEPWEEAGQ